MSAIPESTAPETTTPDTRLEEAHVWSALRGVLDPEVGMDVVSLGLVYDLILRGGEVTILYTLTTPNCPLGDVLERDITDAAAAVPGVHSVKPILVFDPPWLPDFIEENA